jgi:APA family basic amino acid/polyamine antiporter
MSRDGLLPRAFSTVHPRFRTPHKTTILTGVLVAIAAGLVDISTLGQLTSMGTLLAFALVCGGILILRRTEPDAPRPFRAPGYPWVPIIGLLICLYLMSGLPLPTWQRLIIWLVLGILIYFGYGVRSAQRVRATAQRRAA